MNNDINYFSNEGLTSCSASYIANLCKEHYQSLEAELNNLQLYSVTLKLLGTNEEETISRASTYLTDIPNKLEEIAKLKALIAWLRTAIKEKNKLTKELDAYTVEDYVKDNNLESAKYPQCEREMTEEEYLNSLTVKERNRWLTTEALASTIGQAIHKSGSLSKARQDLLLINQKPIETSVNGRDTIIYKRTPAYNGSEIEDVFFILQAKQREAQAELNGMKHQMEIAIENDKALKNEIWQNDLEKYRIRTSENMIKYKEFMMEERKRIQNLKIVIPNNLRDIYDKINSLGKK